MMRKVVDESTERYFSLLDVEYEGAPNLGQVYEDYMSTKKLKNTTLTYYQKCFRNFEDWRYISINNITKRMVARRHLELSQKAPAYANSTMRFLRAMVCFAANYYETAAGGSPVGVNPVGVLSAVGAWNKDGSRVGDFIREEDIGRWFRAVRRLENRTASDFLTFLVLTGCRSMEASLLTWDKVLFASRMIRLNASDTKSSRHHEFPISEYLTKVLMDRAEWSESRFVFEGKSSKHSNGAFTNPAKSCASIVKTTGIQFTPHDLRRSFARIVGHPECGGDELAIKALINHATSDVTQTHYYKTHPERMRPTTEAVTNFILRRARALGSIVVPHPDPNYQIIPPRARTTGPLTISYAVGEVI